MLQPRLFNDIILRPRLIRKPGAVAPSSKVAIYLIFPQFGVQETHLHSLRYIVENGYSPLIISNLPLSDNDFVQLKPLAWRIVQRANFGYDFGGYRDGFLDLKDVLPNLQRLVFLNDSIWFPLQNSANWLRRAEESGKDVYGSELHREILPPALIDFETAEWKADKRQRRLYIPSFAISIGPRVFRSPKYAKFWKKLRISDGKGRTVRRGEHGHSNWLREHGFTYDALLKSADLDFVLSQMPADILDDIWKYFLTDHRNASVVSTHKELCENAVDDKLRVRRRKFIQMYSARTGHAIYIPHFAITQQAYPFLKKRANSPNGTNIAKLADIIRDLNDPLSPAMLAEHQLRYGDH